MCKLILLQVNVLAACCIDFVFIHNRKTNMSLVSLRTGHTFNCRVCWWIIVHWYRCGCRLSLSHQWSTVGNLWLESQSTPIHRWGFVWLLGYQSS